MDDWYCSKSCLICFDKATNIKYKPRFLSIWKNMMTTRVLLIAQMFMMHAYLDDLIRLLKATAYHFESKDASKNRGLESITYWRFYKVAGSNKISLRSERRFKEPRAWINHLLKTLQSCWKQQNITSKRKTLRRTKLYILKHDKIFLVLVATIEADTPQALST